METTNAIVRLSNGHLNLGALDRAGAKRFNFVVAGHACANLAEANRKSAQCNRPVEWVEIQADPWPEVTRVVISRGWDHWRIYSAASDGSTLELGTMVNREDAILAAQAIAKSLGVEFQA